MRLRTAVIGAGISGLAAARALTRLGHAVAVFDAGPRIGGQVCTVPFAGLPVDVGAEAILGGPDVDALVDELGLAAEVVRAVDSRTWVWSSSGLRALPAGVGPAGPTRLRPLLRADVLSARGVARAALEPVVPRRRGTGDVAVGDFVSHRFGPEVTERLVDPLLGGLHAGDVSRLSLRAATPQLAALADDHRSIILARRGRRAQAPPAFLSFRGGMRTFVDALAVDLDVRTSTAVTGVSRTRFGFLLELTDAAPEPVDAVVVALPAAAAMRVVDSLAPIASARLRELRTATVATVLATYPPTVVERTPALAATGMLVPSRSGRLLKSATFLTTKWPHLRPPHRFLVRLSAGRAGSGDVAGLDDVELIARLHADLAEATGIDVEPIEALVRRWPHSLAQLEVGHLDRLRAIRDALATQPRVVLAGAAYDGVGVGACLRSGHRAATRVHHLLERLEGSSG